MNPLVPLVLVSAVAFDPGMSLISGNTLKTTFAKARATQLIIAQQYGKSDPHGEDPHGDDPHDEQHDPGLPSNKENKNNKAPKNVYGNDVYNDQNPYPP